MDYTQIITGLIAFAGVALSAFIGHRTKQWIKRQDKEIQAIKNEQERFMFKLREDTKQKEHIHEILTGYLAASEKVLNDPYSEEYAADFAKYAAEVLWYLPKN